MMVQVHSTLPIRYYFPGNKFLIPNGTGIFNYHSILSWSVRPSVSKSGRIFKRKRGKLVNYVSKSSMCPCYKSVIKCLYFIISVILSILITYWAYVNKQNSLTIFKGFNSILWILILFTFTVTILLNIKKSWHCPSLHHTLVTLSTIVTLAINLIPLLLNSVIYISQKIILHCFLFVAPLLLIFSQF